MSNVAFVFERIVPPPDATALVERMLSDLRAMTCPCAGLRRQLAELHVSLDGAEYAYPVVVLMHAEHRVWCSARGLAA